MHVFKGTSCQLQIITSQHYLIDRYRLAIAMANVSINKTLSIAASTSMYNVSPLLWLLCTAYIIHHHTIQLYPWGLDQPNREKLNLLYIYYLYKNILFVYKYAFHYIQLIVCVSVCACMCACVCACMCMCMCVYACIHRWRKGGLGG